MAAIARLPQNKRKRMKYVRDIPLTNRLSLCRILDVPGPGQNWKQLAGRLGFTADDLNDFERALYSAYGSPTDKMLHAWDAKNHTITELFDKLYQIKHARGMMLLEEFVDEAHRQKIKEIQGEQPDEYHEDRMSTQQMMNPHKFKGQQGSGVEPAAVLHKETRPDANVHRGRTPEQGSHHHSIPVGAGHNHNQPPAAAFWNYQKPVDDEHLPSQSSWNGAPSPIMQGSSTSSNASNDQAPPPRPPPPSNFLDNLDGGTEKQLNSPLVRPASCNSDDNNVGFYTKQSSASDGATKKPSQREERERLAQQAVLGAVMTLKYEDIRKQTDNFSDVYKVGAGSFGTVYYMMHNHTKYAIKRLMQDSDPNSSKNASIFSSQMKEVVHLTSYRHPNVVMLCHHCTDGPEPCLVYEYMQRGSLEDNLQLRWPNKEPLSWVSRNEIMVGAAIGLNFLHTAQEDLPLIHGDIKSANILLDKTFTPKIGDFGLARYGPERGKSYTVLRTSRAYGTLPYLPKDFLKSFKLSVKVDVYSFGIVLMETLTGQKAGDEKREPKNKWLREIVKDIFDDLRNKEEFENEKKIITHLADPKCSDWPWDLAWEVLELSLKCTAHFHQERPLMNEVVATLQGINNRMQEREALRKRSLPTQNTEPLAPGYREPVESNSPNSNELPLRQAPSPARPIENDGPDPMSALEKKFQEANLGRNTDGRTAYPGQEAKYDARYDRYSADGFYGMPPQRQAGNRPNMPLDLRSISQDPSMRHGYGAAVGYSPADQSYPSTTVPSSFMNQPTPPSTNPPLSYDYPQHSQVGYGPAEQRPYMTPSNYGRPSYRHDEQRYESAHRDPRYEHPYSPQQPPYDDRYTQYNRYDYRGPHPLSQYASPLPHHQPNVWPEPPPYYDNFERIPSINPSQFRPGAPASPVPSNQTSNIQGQMSKLDQDQLVYIHRGPDASRETSVASGNNTPYQQAVHNGNNVCHYAQDESKVANNNPSTMRQTSYVHFPNSLVSSSQNSQEATSQVLEHAPPTSGHDAMTRSTSSPVPEKLQCVNLVGTEPSGFTSPPVRNSPVPSEHTDVIPTPQQSVPTDTSSLSPSSSPNMQKLSQQLPSPVSSGDWNGVRKTPVPSQHTDKLPTQRLLSEDHSTTSSSSSSTHPPAGPQQADGNCAQLQCHSAPPEFGMSTEEQLLSLSTMPRVATQMTEPLCEPQQGRK